MSAPDPLPTSVKLEQAHGLYADHPKMFQAIEAIRTAQHAATRKAVLEDCWKRRYDGREDFFGWLEMELNRLGALP